MEPQKRGKSLMDIKIFFCARVQADVLSQMYGITFYFKLQYGKECR